MGKMGRRFFTAKFAEGAEVKGKKHGIRSSKFEINSNDQKPKFETNDRKTDARLIDFFRRRLRRGC